MKKILLLLLIFPAYCFSQTATVTIHATNGGDDNFIKSSELSTKGSSTVNYYNLSNLPTYDLKDFNATGDGLTNDYANINTALTALVATGGTLLVQSGTYKIVGALAKTISNKNIRIEGIGNVVFDFSSITETGSSQAGLNFSFVDGTDKNITSDINIQDTVLYLTTTGITSQDVFLIKSDSVWIGDTWYGELIKVKNVYTDSLSIYTPVYAYYSTAKTTLEKLSNSIVSIENIKFKGPGTSFDKFINLQINGFDKVYIDKVISLNGNYSTCYLNNIAGGEVSNSEFGGCHSEGLGYGLFLGTSQNLTIRKNIFKDSNHGLAMGGTYLVRDIDVIDNTAYSTADHPYVMENHTNAERVNYYNNRVFGGIRIRGVNQIVSGNKITPLHASQNGIDVQIYDRNNGYFTIENNHIINREVAANGIGFYLNHSIDTINKLTIKDNIIDVQKYGILFNHNSSYTKCLIENANISGNEMYSVSGHGIYTFQYYNFGDLILDNNKIVNFTGYATLINPLDSVNSFTMRNNFIENYSSNTPLSLTSAVKKSFILNNQFFGTYNSTPGLTISSDYISIVKDNYFEGLKNNGIILNNTINEAWSIDNIRFNCVGAITNNAGASHIIDIP